MSFSEKYAKAFHYILPTPFSIAIILSAITFIVAFIFTQPIGVAPAEHAMQLLEYWETGLWNRSLMVFAMQMMLILVLGHVLALSPLINKFIKQLVTSIQSTGQAALLVSFFTLLVALFNWGLGLIFGAIFARKVAEHAKALELKINYPIIGAAGYSGLMVWHGGLSGSSLIKVAENAHLKSLMNGIIDQEKIIQLPNQIPFSETVFSSMNIYSSLLVLILLPAFMYWLGKRSGSNAIPELDTPPLFTGFSKENLRGAERIDHSIIPAATIGLIMICYALYKAFHQSGSTQLAFITPDYINFLLLGLAILLHGSFSNFIAAVNQAIGGAAGILIQFPLYFGIMGLMKDSGLVTQLSDFFVSISGETSFPLYTLLSAGIVNVFVPSGGGQWAIQGPIIVQASEVLGVSLPKSIMALAYGDQLTNMLQPFWALPLLGITGLKAREILPYTLLLMLIGSLIYGSALLLF